LATTVSMPQLGETVTEGTILRWAKEVGETISEDEVLVEISTDKVDTEVPSPVSGTILEILVQEGDTVEVGSELVVIGDADEAVGGGGGEGSAEAQDDSPPDSADHWGVHGEEPETTSEMHPASETPSGPDTGFEASGRGVNETRQPTDEEVEAFFAEPSPEEAAPKLLSPVVRRLVRENDVDIDRIEGTGQGGRITRKDVEAYLEKSEEAPTPAEAQAEPPEKPEPPEAPAATAAAPAPAPEPSPAPKPSPAPAAEAAEEVELERIRVRTAENLVNAKRTAAHVWTSVEVDFERVERVRQANKDDFKRDEGFSLTYLPFISRATIDALKEFPVVNSSFDLDRKLAIFHRKIDLGIAIDLNQEGLVVARVRNADGLRLVGIAREIRDLAERGRDRKLDLDDLTGSTFTITNPGPFGSFMSAPIINVPNVAILSTDTVTKRPTVVTSPDGQDMIAIRHIGYLGLSWDHRAFDGSTAVLFLRRIKENLETWDWGQELA
jgi:pyruvate dehydrogenase E2 component (dihydrolipoamide acetyltransferase)